MGVLEVTKEGNIAWVVLNRPDKLNALNFELCEKLYDAFFDLSEDKDVRVIVIKGAGRAFCAGGDLGEFVRFERMNKFLYRLVDVVNQVILMIRRCDKVVIASVHGAVSGGGFGLMACCDLAIAAENTKFNLAYIKIGGSPDMSSSIVLSRTVGLKRASYLAMTGDFIDAKEALDLGLINFVVPDDALEEETKKLAVKMAKMAPLAIKEIKGLINRELFLGYGRVIGKREAWYLWTCQNRGYERGYTSIL